MGLLSVFRKSSSARKFRSAALRFRPQLEGLESRVVPYAVSGNAWPNPQLITLSFMPDGTNLGSGISSNLFSTFNNKFGSPSVWQNQILKAAQVWALQTNLNFAVVADNGALEGSGNYQQGDPGMGDIRIGGYNFNSSVLAQAYLPPPINNFSIAGDIQFNTGQSFNIGSTYDLFTVAVHEIGHALGLKHSAVISADMYANYTNTKYNLAADDINGIRNIYSANNPRSKDQFLSLNGSFLTAANVSLSINPLLLTGAVTNLDITSAGEKDYYAVIAPLLTGNTVTIGVQSSGLSLLAPTLTVYAADQTTVLGTASGAGQYGTTLTVTLTNQVQPLQLLYVKVGGVDNTALGTGEYGLTMSFGSQALPRVPSPNTQLLNGTPLSGGGGQTNGEGQQFMVNSTSTGSQTLFAESPKAVAMDAKGNFVVTWSSYGQDGDGWGIYAQLYDRNGVARGGEFQVNTTTAGDQAYPAVAMDPNGDFVITWSSNGQDGSGWGIYAKKFDANGVSLFGEFQVNSLTTGDQMYSSVAMDANGDFVIAWATNSNLVNGQPVATKGGLLGDLLGIQLNATVGWDIHAKFYNFLGLSLGGEFQVNTTTAGDQLYPDVAMDPQGNFAVTWSSYGQDGSGWGVYAQLYSAAGTTVGNEFQVNTTTTGDQLYPSIAMSGNGTIIITWSSNTYDGTGWNVDAQRYDATGALLGTEVKVNTTNGDSEFSRVAVNVDGDFLVTWTSNGTSRWHQGDPAPTWNVYGQQFSGDDGSASGTKFKINTTSSDTAMPSAITMDNAGHIVVVWSGSSAGSCTEVAAQRYAAAQDDFNPSQPANGADAIVGLGAVQSLVSQPVNLPKETTLTMAAPPANDSSRRASAGLEAGGSSLQPSPETTPSLIGLLVAQSAVPTLEQGEMADIPFFGGEDRTPALHPKIAQPAEEIDDRMETSAQVQPGAELTPQKCDACFAEESWLTASSDFSAGSHLAAEDSEGRLTDPGAAALALGAVLGALHVGRPQERGDRKRPGSRV